MVWGVSEHTTSHRFYCRRVIIQQQPFLQKKELSNTYDEKCTEFWVAPSHFLRHWIHLQAPQATPPSSLPGPQCSQAITLFYILLTLHFSLKKVRLLWCEVYQSTPLATDSTVIVISSYTNIAAAFFYPNGQSNTYDEKNAEFWVTPPHFFRHWLHLQAPQATPL